MPEEAQGDRFACGDHREARAYIVIKMRKLVPIGVAAEALGVAAITMRRREAQGRLVPERTPSGQRRYDLAMIRPELFHVSDDSRVTFAYARASSHDQKDDLERLKQVA
jgi:putative resolvase